MTVHSVFQQLGLATQSALCKPGKLESSTRLAASQSATAERGACASSGWSLNIGIARLSRQVFAAQIQAFSVGILWQCAGIEQMHDLCRVCVHWPSARTATTSLSRAAETLVSTSKNRRRR